MLPRVPSSREARASALNSVPHLSFPISRAIKYPSAGHRSRRRIGRAHVWRPICRSEQERVECDAVKIAAAHWWRALEV